MIAALFVAAIVRVFHRKGRRFAGRGTAARGAVYNLLNEDKQKAMEILVEGRAEYVDPETADDTPSTASRGPVYTEAETEEETCEEVGRAPAAGVGYAQWIEPRRRYFSYGPCCSSRPRS